MESAGNRPPPQCGPRQGRHAGPCPPRPGWARCGLSLPGSCRDWRASPSRYAGWAHRAPTPHKPRHDILATSSDGSRLDVPGEKPWGCEGLFMADNATGSYRMEWLMVQERATCLAEGKTLRRLCVSASPMHCGDVSIALLTGVQPLDGSHPLATLPSVRHGASGATRRSRAPGWSPQRRCVRSAGPRTTVSALPQTGCRSLVCGTRCSGLLSAAMRSWRGGAPRRAWSSRVRTLARGGAPRSTPAPSCTVTSLSGSTGARERAVPLPSSRRACGLQQAAVVEPWRPSSRPATLGPRSPASP
jgi:hypothetical protein